jgi:methionine-rich copper-binding protein CopC
VGASSFSQISSSVALNNSIQCNSDTFPIESHAGRIEAVNAAAFSNNLATTSLILKANNSVLTPVDDLDGKDGGSTSPEVLKTTLPYESLGWDLTTVWDYTAVDYPVLAWEKEIFVTQAPKIISQPQSLNVIEGQEAVFEVTATGGALSYVWTHNGKVIRDETQPRLVIENAQISNQGVYVVTVSNSKGSVESSPATLTIVNVPSITEHPQNKDLNPGDLLDLSVTATGTPPLYYQWYKDGELVPDATSPQFTVASVTETDAGSYTVVVSNAVGSVTSNPAKVTVKEEPPVTEIYLFNPLLILEGGKLYLVFEVKGAAIFNVEGSIDGEHWFDAAYTLTGEGKVKILASQQYVFYRAIAEGTPVDIAPEITSSPQNVELFVGDKLDLSVTATVTPPLNYQWYKDGEPIPGAALPQLTIPSVTEVDAGVYTVVVSNTAGSATSNPARVNVYVLPLDEAILLNPTIKDGYFYFYLDIPVWVTQEMIQVWHKTPNADWVIEKNASIDITRNEVLVPRLPGSALYKVVIVGPP